MKPIRGTLNHIELIGYLGSDPDHRILATGASVANFSIATKRYGARSESGQRGYETDWTNVEAWDKLAELCSSYLHKGSQSLFYLPCLPRCSIVEVIDLTGNKASCGSMTRTA